VGDVQAALAGEQELAPGGGHGVVQINMHAAFTQDLGGHESRRTAADDRGRP